MHRHSLVESLESRLLLTGSISAISSQSVPGGKSIFVPVYGTTNGLGVNYAASCPNSQVSVQVMSEITYVQMQVSINGVAQGALTLALFGNIAPNTVSSIVSLVNSGFYNNNTFHRIITGFMAQGGAVNSGTLPTIADEFNSNAIFDTPYLLAMANANSGSTCDTGNSQFFITVDQTRWLDFHHTIFGQLVGGLSVLNQIMAVGTSGGTPSASVVITSASVIADTHDTVLIVHAAAGVSNAQVTVTGQDQNSTFSKTFSLSSYTDTTDDPPYLNPTPASITTYADTPVSFNLTATDIDGGTITLARGDGTGFSSVITGNTVTITPNSAYTGDTSIIVGVVQDSTPKYDTQVIPVHVIPKPTVTNGVLVVSGSGADDVATIISNGTTYVVTINGQSQSFATAGITGIVVSLGAGNDLFSVGAGMPNMVIYGGDGNDTLSGGAGNDTLFGGAGNDSLVGGDGHDAIRGEDGNDTIWGQAGDDRLYGDKGFDLIYGGDGNDLMDGGTGSDTMYGGRNADYMTGAAGNDAIYGEDGKDALFGGDGNNTLDGGNGNDSLVGGANNDVIYAIDPSSTIAYNDTVIGGGGTDTAHVNAVLDSASGIASLLYA